MISAQGRHRAIQTWTLAVRTLGAGLVIVALSTSTHVQSFSSGSDGSDGALTIAADQGIIIFDPNDMARWGRVLDPDGDGVYNFTTITINSGSTLKLQGDRVNRPVYWLASGDVIINGALDLSGGLGIATNDITLRRQLAIPGSGGYAGGAPGIGTSAPATPGEGPGGGSGTAGCGFPSFQTANGGTFTGNRYLIPLFGGSGGAGMDGLGGGAGGGAILIASSTTITSSPTMGVISVHGGRGAPSGFPTGGGGSGGAIRLVAPTIAGPAQLDVTGGVTTCGSTGGPGLVRLEGFTISTSISILPGSTNVTRGSPVNAITLRPASSIRVTAIDGVAVPPNPSGSFVLPDVAINKNVPVNVDIQASGIPPGTVIRLQVYPQTPTDLTVVNLPIVQATLAGTVQSSTATIPFTFPYGFSRGFVRASWTQ